MQYNYFTDPIKTELPVLNANVNNGAVHMQKRILCLQTIHAGIYRK